MYVQDTPIISDKIKNTRFPTYAKEAKADIKMYP
jgi:hypothetical protein